MLRVIIAEDERIVRTNIAKFIDAHLDEFTVEAVFSDGREAIEYLATHSIDIVIADIKMPEQSGLDVAKYVYDHALNTAVIIISAYRDFSYAHKAIEYKVCAYLLKPVMTKELRKSLMEAQQFLNKGKLETDTPQPLPIVRLDENNAEVTGEQRMMEKAIDYIQKNYNYDISLHDVAKHVHLSDNYFSSLFKKNQGENFANYLTLLRIKEAIRLLDTGRYTVNEVGLRVGYKNSNYFIKVFKSHTNLTPKQYCVQLKKGIER